MCSSSVSPEAEKQRLADALGVEKRISAMTSLPHFGPVHLNTASEKPMTLDFCETKEAAEPHFGQ
jgi:hypothetical protein